MSLFKGETPDLGSPVGVGVANIYSGSQVTRAGVLAEVGKNAPEGSIYLGAGGHFYVKVANTNASTDWQKITATAAD